MGNGQGSILELSRELLLSGHGNKHTNFQDLMKHRVNNILLISSLYDSFILAQDGQLQEMIVSEYMELNLSHTPNITRVARGDDALKLLEDTNDINLIITTSNLPDMSSTQFAQKVKEADIKTPIVLLTYDSRDLVIVQNSSECSAFDRIYLWQGDFRILLAIIKQVEDRLNIENDTDAMDVQTIIVVEDNIKFYSSYLPMLYTETMLQSQLLIKEGINLAHKVLRMRARPKIILCTEYEEAWAWYEKYKNNILGVITDMEYSRNGKLDSHAGEHLTKKIREIDSDTPILLQSANRDGSKFAIKYGAQFIRKNTPTLIRDLQKYIRDNYGFGDFVFRDENNDVIGGASDLRELEIKILTISLGSILYHSSRNHFSKWMIARTEFALARKLRPSKVEDFEDPELLRTYLIQSIKKFRTERSQGVIADYSKRDFDATNSFTRIGEGSLGGKARGLAFLTHMINFLKLRNRYDGITVNTPTTLVIGTEIFEQFMKNNDLTEFAISEENEDKVRQRFLEGEFSEDFQYKLQGILHSMTYPLAVRSSSLLEDSHFQPFAGIYSTYMLANNHFDIYGRLDEVLNAIKLVFASTYSQNAKSYIKSTPFRIEEEKMAVIIQRVVGSRHEDRFYPNFAGVARSYNSYPNTPAKSIDGFANVGLGLGSYIVGGGEGVRFCPKYPKHSKQFATIKDTLRFSQKSFNILEMVDPKGDRENIYTEEGKKYPISQAETDYTLHSVASVYSNENDAIYDGLSREGARLVTFAPILKHDVFPLAKILKEFLDLGTLGISRPVELEFAVNLQPNEENKKEFSFLQLRPLVMNQENDQLDLDDVDIDDCICQSDKVLGSGVINSIYNIVLVDRSTFDRSKTREVADAIGEINLKLVEKEQPYLLIGIGRWGSSDPWLGIPVGWKQISGAKAIVESGFDDMIVTPSEGAHFFHNITSFQIGYFTVNSELKDGFLDWEWLLKKRSVEQNEYVRHLQFRKPLTVRMNGIENRGVILKPTD
jgi:CheY-like chemotaxis protein